MEVISLGTIIAVAGAITTVGGAYLTLKQIQKDSRKEAERNSARILQEAKEADERVKIDLENKLRQMEVKLFTLEESVNKDLDHIKETYNGEIRNLGAKIEELRHELRDQHGSLVKLLSKLIEVRPK